MKLYTYYRSSAAFRVRIALNLKGVSYEAIPVHLLRNGGEQHAQNYRALNPMAVVPTLITDTSTLVESMAIIEWLDETQPGPGLMPHDADGRARVRALAQAVACEIHPLNNTRVLNYLTGDLGLSEEQKNRWYRHWVERGLAAVEAMLANDRRTGNFCHGDAPTMADCCLVPQVFNARRYNCSLAEMPTINRIVAYCETLPAFQRAMPANQPDAE